MNYTSIFYVLASVLFILGIKKLSHPKTARNGNFLSACGMFIAIVSTLIANDDIDLLKDNFPKAAAYHIQTRN